VREIRGSSRRARGNTFVQIAHLGDARWVALRRRIDRAVVRALADPHFGSALLADPATVLAAPDPTGEQRARLRSIRARTLKEFAAQATRLFWATERSR
jgi:hypothetical protein